MLFSKTPYELILFTFLMLSFHCLSQEYSYRHYTVLDGLAQNQVTYLFQDSKGYIWIATKGGVSRFDGHTFKSFTIGDGLLANYVIRVLEDTRGRINFWTYLGMSRLEKDTITTVYLSDTLDVDRRLRFVEMESGTEWWIHHGDHFDRYSGKEKAGEYILPAVLHDQEIASIAYDELHDKLYISMFDSNLYMVRNQQAKCIATIPNNRFFELADGRIYLFGNEVVYILDTESDRFSEKCMVGPYTGGKSEIDRDGKLYSIINTDFISVWDGNETITLSKDFNYINTLLADAHNNLWIGTETGLYRRISDAYVNFTPESGCPEYVWSIVEDTGQDIWLASYGNGLGRYQDGKIVVDTSYKQVYKYQKGDYFYTGANLFSDGNLYFPVKGAGVLKFDGRSYSLLKGVPPKSVLDVFEDTTRKQVLIASTDGLVLWKDDTVVAVHKHDFDQSKKYIKAMAADKYGRYWLGGEYMLRMYDGNTFVSFPNDTCDYAAGAIALYTDRHKNLWLGTTSGLYFYDYKAFRRIAPGQLNFQVASFAAGNNSLLYMGTSRGLVHIDLDAFYERSEEQVKQYDAPAGFLGFDCIRNGILADSKGRIWTACSERVVRFDPAEYQSDTVAPDIVIESLSLAGVSDGGVRINGYNVPRDSVMELKASVRSIRFDYHAIHFYAPERIRYKYRLLGYDNNWSEETAERFVSFTNLSPGSYTFEVIARNSDGIWSPLPDHMAVNLVPAFWQTLWFRLLVNFVILLVALYLFFTVYRFFRKRKELEASTQRQIHELQMKTIKSQMDPHFTFNALNTISAVIYKEEKEKAYRYLTKFSRLVRASLEVSDRISRHLDEEIEFTTDYLDLEKIRFNEDFHYSVDIAQDVDLKLSVPKMIIQNYAENAVKHGLKHKKTDRSLAISIGQSNGSLSIVVEDNGIGRKKASLKNQRSTGKGLKIMDSMYALYHNLYKVRIRHVIEDLYDPKGKACGTRVKIEIPLGSLQEIK